MPKVRGQVVKTRMKVVMIQRDGLEWRLLLAGPSHGVSSVHTCSYRHLDYHSSLTLALTAVL